LSWKLTVNRECQEGVAVLSVVGRLGAASSGSLIEAIVGAIEAGDQRLLIDLTSVDYVSSAGLLALDAAAGRMHVAGGSMTLCGLTEPVRLAFELSGLLPHFSVEPSRDIAVAKLAAGD
jgi:anti-anti-sigma factor